MLSRPYGGAQRITIPIGQYEVNNFTGDAKTVLQAGAVHGDVLLHEKSLGLPPPRQLPTAPTNFVNRAVEVRALHEIFAESAEAAERGPSAAIYTLSGSPGVGKTALALHWAHQVRERFPDGDLYVDLQGYGPTSSITPSQVLDAFLRALGMPVDRIPEALGDRASLYRSVLNGKRILVLIDNASESTQVLAERFGDIDFARRLRLLDDPHSYVRQGAAMTFRRLAEEQRPTQAEQDTLHPHLERAQDDPDHFVRTSAAQALAHLTPARPT